MSEDEHDRRIDYIEFTSTDLEATKHFYSEVFGWEFTDYGPDYTSFQDGRLAGGFTKGKAGGGSPLVVLFASNLDTVQAAVEKWGVKTFNPHSFPGGRRFHFKDPGGNELAVWAEK
ncbi:MAG: VOC family protein [Gemmatimonadota bacterium]|nr:VOC family protein [Gemmatimonadota bacterium]